jgi:hypothetical protein
MSSNAQLGLIGHTGFVGMSLKRQHSFDRMYRSSDIHEIANESFDNLICAGAPAKKWLANQQPDDDRASIRLLIDSLSTVKCRKMILISTVDVYSDPSDVDETTTVDTSTLHPYGLHRRELEEFIENRFPSTLILRLPALVGPGLKKNVIYDIHNQNELASIDSRGVFQFYPMVNLWSDIQRAIELGVNLVHLTAEPLSVSQISAHGFGMPYENHILKVPPAYDFQSIYASDMGGAGRYTYSKREVLQAVRSYAQTEHKSDTKKITL